MNQPAPYAEELQFNLQHGNTEDNDEAKLIEPLNQAVEKVKEIIGDK